MDTQFLTVLSPEKVLSKALNIVSDSEKVIRATMLVGEDIKQPLPIIYHKEVQKSLGRGCAFKRLAFGSRQQIKLLSPEYKEASGDYRLRLFSDARLYQRLLIGDQKEALFKIEDSNRQSLICYTKFGKLVEALIDYFEKLYTQAGSFSI